MKLSAARKYALSLPGASEQPHFNYASFRVGKKIFVTVPPDGDHLHIFVPEEVRESALAMHPQFVEKLTWGSKVVGVRVDLEPASASVVNQLVLEAWRHKAPKP